MREMKVGDRVMAEYTVRGTSKRVKVEGKIIGFNHKYDQFVFESLEGHPSGSPFHEAEIYDGKIDRYFLDGYGVTDEVEASPSKRRFNGLKV